MFGESEVIYAKPLMKKSLVTKTAMKKPHMSAIKAAGTACLVFFIPTEPKYTAMA